MTTILLAYGVDLDVQGRNLDTTLTAALHEGSMTLMQILLDNGAGIDSQGGWYGNAV